MILIVAMSVLILQTDTFYSKKKMHQSSVLKLNSGSKLGQPSILVGQN